MDRHKGPRHFASGAAKRRVSKERTEREAQELAKTRRMTEFFTEFTRPSASEADSDHLQIQYNQSRRLLQRHQPHLHPACLR